jgi:hypothetical protein
MRGVLFFHKCRKRRLILTVYGIIAAIKQL